jgi:hypothetical protein
MNVSQSIQSSFTKSLTALKDRKGFLTLLIIILALVAFEAFNFSTTDFALSDLLGDLRFGGIRWATLLSIAFCGIDFAGIARLFSTQSDKEAPQGVWFMFGAWFLAATMNAILTWWGVVMAMQTHPVLSAGVVDATFVTKTVPIFIALMVWVIRILLMGSFSRKSEHLMQAARAPEEQTLSRREYRQAQSRAAQAQRQAAHAAGAKSSVPAGFSISSASKVKPGQKRYRPEPIYIPMQAEGTFHTMKASESRRRGA